MSESLLTQYVEAGFPHLKEITQWPEPLLPGLPRVAKQLGDAGMLKLAEPLDLAERIKASLAEAPEPCHVQSEVWREGIENWSAVHQVVPVVLALLRAAEKIEAIQRRGRVKIDSARVARSLATIAYAIFVPEGAKILDRIAGILGGSAAEPTALLSLYVQAVEQDDRETQDRVEEGVVRDPVWAEWSQRFLTTGKSFPYIPKVIGISPVDSSELTQLLAAMFKEELDVEHSGNNPERKS